MSPDSSAEKTEKATPKKREDARKEGQVLKSSEVNTAVTMVVMFGAIQILGSGMINQIMSLMTQFLSGQVSWREAMTIEHIGAVFSIAAMDFVEIVLPILLVALVIGVAVNILQVGFLFTGKVLMPKFSRINPLSGFKRIFSMRALFEMVKSIAKITVIAFIVYQEYMANFGNLPNLMAFDLAHGAATIFSIAMNIAFKASVALVVLGVFDYGYQWWDYEKNLKMTKEEVKQEYKQQEGDPKVKSRIRQKQREMSTRRMMQALPNADVVITNPTHYAVALRYQDGKDEAPVVLAKGKDLIAKKIREMARENHIEIVENKPLAQALYFTVEIGQQIPEDMYAAVADILAYVYNQKNNIPARRQPAPSRV